MPCHRPSQLPAAPEYGREAAERGKCACALDGVLLADQAALTGAHKNPSQATPCLEAEAAGLAVFTLNFLIQFTDFDHGK